MNKIKNIFSILLAVSLIFMTSCSSNEQTTNIPTENTELENSGTETSDDLIDEFIETSEVEEEIELGELI